MMRKKFVYCPLCGKRLKRMYLEGRQRSHCRTCGWVHYKNPLPVTLCVARNKRGEVLLIKRNIPPGLNQWAFPGGFIEIGESPDDACIRELHEETGIRATVKRLIGIYVQDVALYGHLLLLGYEVEIKKSAMTLNYHEVSDANYFSKKTMPHVPFSTHKKILKDIKFY